MRHLSTFSGCGGSSTGVEMTGLFDTVAAVEIDTNAADVYELNHPGTPVIRDDIRRIVDAGADYWADYGLAPGELDLLEGSPPCSKFSTIGQRQQAWGKVTAGDSTVEQENVEDLFGTFIDLARVLRPKAVVAENVPAMAQGMARGFFASAMDGLEAMGYYAAAAVLDAGAYGVPQKRRRLYIVAIRRDLGVEPSFPAPTHADYVTMAEASPWMRRLIMREKFTTLGTMVDYADTKAPFQLRDFPLDRPAPTIASNGFAVGCDQLGAIYADDCPPPLDPLDRHPSKFIGSSVGRVHKRRSGGEQLEFVHIDDLRLWMGFPAEYRLLGSYAKRWARLGNAVPPPLSAAVAGHVGRLIEGR